MENAKTKQQLIDAINKTEDALLVYMGDDGEFKIDAMTTSTACFLI